MTTKKIGRPRRTKDAATVRVTIRLSPAERALLERAAGGLPLSDWIRDVAIEAASD